MTTFNITPEQRNNYKVSLDGIRKTRRRLKRTARNKESELSTQAEYRIELLNVIEGYMKAVLSESDKRFQFRDKYFGINKKH